MSWLFKIALGADILAVLIGLYFIISDSITSSSSKNGALSVATLGMCAWIGICYFLFSQGYGKIATVLAWIPAFPLLGYGLMVVIMVIGKPDFK